MRAPTAGHSFNASVTALVKNDIKPKPTPCFSLNFSLYFARNSIIGCISTSLKVVSMAVSFLTVTKRLATVLRNDDIFSRLSVRSPGFAGADGAAGAAAAGFAAGAATGALCAFNASSFVILPPTPLPFKVDGSTPFSANIFAAAGDGVPDA